MSPAEHLEVRQYEPRDRPAVLALLSSSLGWLADDHHRAFFSWKHDENPFGRSLAWVAVDGDQLAGFRTFLRWEFAVAGGGVRRAVRAVDTATHPDHRGRGVFSLLTRYGLEALPAAGVDFVFNTPNDQSRPGYLKMGWQVVGRLPVRVRPRSPAALAKMLGARTPAELWSVSTDRGADAVTALADAESLARVLATQPAPRGLATRRTPEQLRWRYAGFPPLQYRVTAPRGLADGFAVWRLRRRGPALEAAIVEVVVPGGDARHRRRLADAAARESGADYAVVLAEHSGNGFVALPRQGPVLTWRSERDDPCPPLRSWRLGLGDVELF